MQQAINRLMDKLLSEILGYYNGSAQVPATPFLVRTAVPFISAFPPVGGNYATNKQVELHNFLSKISNAYPGIKISDKASNGLQRVLGGATFAKALKQTDDATGVAVVFASQNRVPTVGNPDSKVGMGLQLLCEEIATAVDEAGGDAEKIFDSLIEAIEASEQTTLIFQQWYKFTDVTAVVERREKTVVVADTTPVVRPKFVSTRKPAGDNGLDPVDTKGKAKAEGKD